MLPVRWRYVVRVRYCTVVGLSDRDGYCTVGGMSGRDVTVQWVVCRTVMVTEQREVYRAVKVTVLWE
ncbi:hypothetical protein chiPu_0026944, partial [Chiloscyllium punctatum]|nr:hypothetical protein [Chiloscyllium punctatum]